MEQENRPLVECRELKKMFRQGRNTILAVNDLNLSICQGEVLGLVGESGCGKSTLGHLFTGIEEPTAGTLLLNGEDVTSPTQKRRRELCKKRQIVFQDPYASIDTGKTIGWLLEEPLKIHRLSDRADRIGRILTAVGLDESYLRRFPSELSGGQRQRVAIALALILEPEFVVCDEPVSALDVSVQAQVLNLLLELRASLGLTYLFISHDLNVVSYLSDRVGVMYLGNLIELGTNEEIVNTPLHPYTQALFSAAQGGVLSGELPSPADPPGGCPFHTRCPECTERCKSETPPAKDMGGARMVRCFQR